MSLCFISTESVNIIVYAVNSGLSGGRVCVCVCVCLSACVQLHVGNTKYTNNTLQRSAIFNNTEHRIILNLNYSGGVKQ